MSGVEIVKVKNEDEGIRLNRWFLKYYPVRKKADITR